MTGNVSVNTLSLKTDADHGSGEWSGTYFSGLPLTLQANPARGYRFSHWEVKGLHVQDAGSATLVISPSVDISVRAVMEKED